MLLRWSPNKEESLGVRFLPDDLKLRLCSRMLRLQLDVCSLRRTRKTCRLGSHKAEIGGNK